MMMCEKCGTEFVDARCQCGWAAPDYQPPPIDRGARHGISLEEFGVDLFAVVKACAQIELLRKWKRLGPTPKTRPEDVLARAKAEEQALGVLREKFVGLPAEDQLQVLDKYPWVTQC